MRMKIEVEYWVKGKNDGERKSGQIMDEREGD